MNWPRLAVRVGAGRLREILGLGPRKTPQDRMGYVPLATLRLAQGLVEHRLATLGPGVPLKAQAQLVKDIAREMSIESIRKLGPGWKIGKREDPKRGLLIDVVRSELASPEPVAS